MAAAHEATHSSLAAGAAKNGSEDDTNDDYEHRALLGTAHDPEPPKGRALTLLLCGIAAGIYEVRAVAAPNPPIQVDTRAFRALRPGITLSVRRLTRYSSHRSRATSPRSLASPSPASAPS